jgi:hypothetical protein
LLAEEFGVGEAGRNRKHREVGRSKSEFGF